MKVGVVGNPRYGDLKGVLEHLALGAPSRGISIYSESRLESFWGRDVPDFNSIRLDALITFGGDGTAMHNSLLSDDQAYQWFLCSCSYRKHCRRHVQDIQ